VTAQGLRCITLCHAGGSRHTVRACDASAVPAPVCRAWRPGRTSPMALRNVLVDAAPQDVWELLSDGRSYAEWVVGTTHIRDVDPQWPAVGSRLAYEARMGPWRVKDESIVRVCEPPQR